jgi:DMSO/TMAO reductase YedYZ molybdopterin-dependent catalytic subunit
MVAQQVHTTTEEPLTFEELQLAGRNHSMPLESLRYDITPAGLHYILVHFDIPALDAASWRVRIGGMVATPLELSLDDIRSRPRADVTVTMECAGNGRALMSPRSISQPWVNGAVGNAVWSGTPLSGILDEAELDSSAVELVFWGADRGVQNDVEQTYARALTIDEARRPDVILAYEMNGSPLLPQHGYPLRLLVPGWYGMTSVKWLTSIEAVREPFAGFQQADAYRYQRDADDPGERVTRIRVRSLMVPPGIPDFLTRRRILDAGLVALEGKAWSGVAPVAGVQVGIDGDWHDADMGPAPRDPYAWRAWSYAWDAQRGEHTLSCRATDAAGNVQPLEAPWNVQGMGNNAVQVVSVAVRP